MTGAVVTLSGIVTEKIAHVGTVAELQEDLQAKKDATPGMDFTLYDLTDNTQRLAFEAVLIPPPPPPEEFLSRNRIINGDMRIDQTNGGSAVTVNSPATVHSVDMFKGAGIAAAGVFTLQRSTATPPQGFSHLLRAICTVADPTINVADSYSIRTSIEGINLTDFRLGTPQAAPMALSFWVRSSLAGIYSGSIFSANSAYSYVFQYTINAVNAWERKTIEIPGPTAGTWATDATGSMHIQFALALGSSLAGAPGAWTASNLYGSPQQVNFLSSNISRTFDLTGVQLEPGLKATAFKYRPLSTEERLAMRYLHVLGGAADLSLAMAQNITATLSTGPYRFPVNLRSIPTFTIKNQTHFVLTNRSNGVYPVITLGVDTITTDGCRLMITVAGGQAAGYATSLMCGAFTDAVMLFDSRI